MLVNVGWSTNRMRSEQMMFEFGLSIIIIIPVVPLVNQLYFIFCQLLIWKMYHQTMNDNIKTLPNNNDAWFKYGDLTNWTFDAQKNLNEKNYNARK